MANQYFADVPKGFSVPKQVRVDYKTNIQNENTLKNLGVNNNLAFTYYEGLEVYCKEEKTKYVWREVNGIETGLLPLHFTYPTYPAIDGINYSGKQFNFFLINENQISADGSETKLNPGQNITITGQGTSLLPYTISANFENELTFIESGTNVTITGTGSEIDPYIINSNVNDLGLIKENNNRVLAPNQSLSLINSDVTGKALVTKEYVDNISIPIVDGSETKINPGNNVTITGGGTQLDPYIINSVSEQSSIFINSTDQIDVAGNGTLENPYTFFNLGLDLKANLESPIFTGIVTAPVIVGKLTGNANTATKLETPITINNVSFDGSTSITITDDSREPRINKQNSLLPDGTGNKFVTVDAVNNGLNTKQSLLISGTNIKTINGNSLLGSGNVEVITDISGKEDVANKSQTLTVSSTLYPSNNAVIAGLSGKENIISAGTTVQYFRGDKTFQTLDKTAVGLANVDNTSDLNKPINTATQTALNLKANLASPTFTGVPLAPTATAGTNTTQVATTAFVLANATNIPHLESNSTDLTIWNNGKGNNGGNTSFGESALRVNTTGSTNTANGAQVLKSNTTGSANTAAGFRALEFNTTGINNTANGVDALGSNTTGDSNTAIGERSGSFIANGVTGNTAGSNSVFIGISTRALADNQTNQIVIGQGAIGAGSNTATLGNTNITSTILRGTVSGGSFVKNSAPSTNLLLAGGGDIAQSTFVQGSGTANFLPKFTASGTVGNSLNSELGTNFGFNVTPTDGVGTQNFEMVNGSTIGSRTLVPQLYISSNASGQAFSPTRKVSGFATQYVSQGFDGSHSWATAPTGVAGSPISWVSRMMLDNIGKLTLADLAGTGTRIVTASPTGQIGASISPLLYANQTITANKTVTIAEFVNNNELILSVNATSGNVTITLPTFTALQGYKVTVKKMDNSANSVLITGVGGVNIDGAASVIISGQYSSSTVGANLSQYIIL